MRPLQVTAMTAVSALGVGAAAHRAALLAEASGLRPNDFDPSVGGWIGRVAGVEDHRLPARMAAYDCRNNRLADMALGPTASRPRLRRRRRGMAPGGSRWCWAPAPAG